MAEALTRTEIMAWRKAERARLLGERRALASAARRAASQAILETLAGIPPIRPGSVVSLYWPINHEPNLLPLIERFAGHGIRFALPIVVERGQPLIFRTWKQGEPLERGFWDIPVPAAGVQVQPDILIAPIVGHDSACYRLGYGGGYFDRTLAGLPARTAYGVGYSGSRLATIHPLPHDIPMTAIITESGLFHPA